MFKLLIIYVFSSISGYSALAQDNIPLLNQKVVEYVKSVIGTQVDRGECWDLANQALTRIHAKWDGEYKYGQPINPEKDIVFPGDIIQFENVKVFYRDGNTIFKEFMTHHTAIIIKVFSQGKYEIAHQNTGFSGRKVGISNLDLKTIIKGKVYFYQPVGN